MEQPEQVSAARNLHFFAAGCSEPLVLMCTGNWVGRVSVSHTRDSLSICRFLRGLVEGLLGTHTYPGVFLGEFAVAILTRQPEKKKGELGCDRADSLVGTELFQEHPMNVKRPSYLLEPVWLSG